MARYAAFFDLDKTILTITSGRVLAMEAYRKGILTKTHLIKGVFSDILLKSAIIKPERIMLNMATWLKGIEVSEIEAFCLRMYGEILSHHVRDEIRKEISTHKERGGTTIILSAAIPEICKPVQADLKMDAIICSKLETQEGIFTGKPAGPYCFGEEKLTRITAYCAENNLNLDEAWYYGDSVNDIPVLECVGYAVWVPGNKKLEKRALHESWQPLWQK